MNKSKSEKLLDSIGTVSDRWVNELIEEPEAKASASMPIAKRLVFAAVAALLCVSCVVTAFAYGDEIFAAIFERRKALVDDKIGYIDESATVGNITLTVDKVVVNQKVNYMDSIEAAYTISFCKEGGVFDKGLKYGDYALELLIDADDPRVADKDSLEVQDGKKWYVWSGKGLYDYDAFYPPILEINFGLDNPSDTITLTSIPDRTLYGKSRLTFYDLTSADGSIKYADEISVEFEVTEEKAPPLQQLCIYDPDIGFEVEGVEFIVTRIELTPEYMHVSVGNPTADRVNIGGKECYAINYFTKYANSDESIEFDKEIQALDAEKAEYYKQKYADLPDNAYIEKYYSEWLATDERAGLEAELAKLNYKTDDEKILAECYEIAVEIKPESGAQITNMNTSLCSWRLTETMTDIDAGMFAYFSSPIYVDDIVRVYARKIGDPSKEVNIWVSAEDKRLEELGK